MKISPRFKIGKHFHIWFNIDFVAWALPFRIAWYSHRFSRKIYSIYIFFDFLCFGLNLEFKVDNG